MPKIAEPAGSKRIAAPAEAFLGERSRAWVDRDESCQLAKAAALPMGAGSPCSLPDRSLTRLRFYQAQELAGVIGEAGKDRAQVAVAQVAVDDFA
jgi:hypothetical protein